MNKLEYIPGDIVKIEYGEATGKIGFVTNTFLRRKGCYSLVVFIGKGFQGSSKDDWIQTYNDEVSPIPLTTEILEKNGWEFVGGQVDEDGFTWDIYSNRGVLPDLYYYPDGKFSVFMYGKEVLPDIEYIHQLQHILFGLGLNSEMEV